MARLLNLLNGYQCSTFSWAQSLTVARRTGSGWGPGGEGCEREGEASWPFLLLSFSIFGRFLVKNYANVKPSQAVMTQSVQNNNLNLTQSERENNRAGPGRNQQHIDLHQGARENTLTVYCAVPPILSVSGIKCGNITFSTLRQNWNSKPKIK